MNQPITIDLDLAKSLSGPRGGCERHDRLSPKAETIASSCIFLTAGAVPCQHGSLCGCSSLGARACELDHAAGSCEALREARKDRRG